ncbi:MAG: 1,6-anhydro-N-acetylmuramyl-L-alanine amidase AmpD [Rhodoferax sp.]
MTEVLPHPATLWQDGGWYRFARRLESPHCGPRPPQARVDLLVLHSISLPPGVYGGNKVQALFTGQLDWDQHPFFQSIRGLQVSAHFYIQRSGDIWQFVSCDARAWHAGVSHYRGRDNCNDDSIGIELEGSEGEYFESTQYEALQALCPALAQRYPIAHIAGHEHIAPGRKADPGSGLDWARLQQTLGLQAECFPTSVRTSI